MLAKSPGELPPYTGGRFSGRGSASGWEVLPVGRGEGAPGYRGLAVGRGKGAPGYRGLAVGGGRCRVPGARCGRWALPGTGGSQLAVGARSWLWEVFLCIQ